MDGIILIDKIQGITSYDVIRKVKKAFHSDKVGHCGTLDPFATGLLIICINQATKVMSFMQHDYKEYIATVKLGSSTDTFDLDSKVIKESAINDFSLKELEDVCKNKFLGKINQIPPKYSAISINGKKLYEYARNNIEVDIPNRKVEIFDLKILSKTTDTFTFYVKCSMGTYIRSLGVDIASSLNNDAHLIELKRISIGNINLSKANSYDDLLNNNVTVYDIRDFILYKNINTNDPKILIRVYNGQDIILKNEKEEMLLIVDNNKVIAIYKKMKTEGFYHCYRGLYNEDIRIKRLKQLSIQ